jgi:hypothetical protein
MDNINYLNLITSAYRNKDNFIAWLTGGLDLVDSETVIADAMTGYFAIDTAIGSQLDILGDILGQSRTVDFQPTDGSSSVLDDDNYRILLKAKIIINLWDGTISEMATIWSSLFPSSNLVVTDNQDMTMNVGILGEVSLMVRDMVKYGYIIPKPQSVGINYFFYGDGPIFGYDIDNEYFSGYDKGKWALTEKTTLFGYDLDNQTISGYDAGAW